MYFSINVPLPTDVTQVITYPSTHRHAVPTQAEHVQDEASDRFRAWRTRREPRIPKPPGPVCPLWGDLTKQKWKENTGKKPGTMKKGGKTTRKPGGNSKDWMDLRTQDLGEVQGGFFC